MDRIIFRSSGLLSKLGYSQQSARSLLYLISSYAAIIAITIGPHIPQWARSLWVGVAVCLRKGKGGKGGGDGSSISDYGMGSEGIPTFAGLKVFESILYGFSFSVWTHTLLMMMVLCVSIYTDRHDHLSLRLLSPLHKPKRAQHEDTMMRRRCWWLGAVAEDEWDGV